MLYCTGTGSTYTLSHLDMPVTIDDIAARARVSRMTVSNVLSGRVKHVLPQAVRRAERIREIAAAMGYRPNAAARAVSQGRCGAAGLLLSMNEATSAVNGWLLRGLDTALAEHDTHLTLIRLPDAKLVNEGYVPKLLREFAVDGLLINYHAHIPPQLIELIERHRTPSVWINSKQPHDSVYPDDYRGAYDATVRLIGDGHRAIAFLDYSTDWAGGAWHYSSVDRRDGYLKAMTEAGLAPRLIADGYVKPEHRLEATRRWLHAPDRPTAVLSYTREELRPIINLTLNTSIRIGRDLALATFGALPVSSELLAPIGTMMIPHEQIGRKAVELLMNKIGSPFVEEPSVAMPLAWRD
jgi:LacI family transcriptional regulator